MLYEFRSEDGSVIVREYPMAEAPDFGAEVEEGGRIYRRVPSVAQIQGAHEGSTKFPRFESSQLPKWWIHHKGEFSPTGKPRYSTRQEIEEDMARARAAGTEIEYGSL